MVKKEKIEKKETTSQIQVPDAESLKKADIPDYKKVWEQMKQDPEIGFVLRTEGYSKAECILLYQILEELRKK